MNNPFESIDARLSNIETLLLDIKHSSTRSEETSGDRWMNISELIDYLPSRPVRVTVYTWTSRGEIPFHRRGKRLYFLKSEIDTWLKEGRHKTLSELRKEVSIPIKTR